MVTNSICLCYLKWILWWPKEIFRMNWVLYCTMWCTDGINVVKHDGKFVQNGEWAYKIQGFSCESNEQHAKCSSCKLIYGHAQQQCKSIHQSTSTYLFKWVRRNDTWITLDSICTISISSIRILFVLFHSSTRDSL